MYDRKTWIIVIACSVLIAINLHFQSKNNREQAAYLDTVREEEQAAAPAAGAAPEEKPGELAEKPPEPPAEEQRVELVTDEVRFTLTTLAAGVRSAELINQASVVEEGRNVVLNDDGSSPVGALADGADRMEAVNYQYDAAASEEGRRAVFTGRHPSGLEVRKVYSLTPADQPGHPFLLDFELQVSNTNETTLPLEQFSVFLGTAVPLHRREFTPSGFFWREDGEFHFIKAVKDSRLKQGLFSGAKGMIAQSADEMEFVGVSSQLFATVLRPEEVTSGGVWAKGQATVLHGEEAPVASVRAGYNLPARVLAPGDQQTMRFKLYMGPKENRVLRSMGDGWGDVMNYGWFSPISRLMSWLLGKSHDLVAKVSDKWSWGFAIIIVTLVVRTVMWPAYAKSNHTMKRMAKLKPEMDRLKEKYPDDPQKMQQEVMGLYRKFGINPLGGCLPMFFQIPVFFGFYRMLQYAVELRGGRFLWVDDLSMPDTVAHVMGVPINILPIVMGLSSFAQIAMTPTPSADKTQQTIMRLMPLMFFIFCYNFASALALYWTTSNLFSIFQTWLTKRMPEPELKERPKSNRKGFAERMAEMAEQQQKMRKAQGRVVEDEPKKKRGPRTGG